MVNLSNLYFFSAKEIECIEPYSVKVNDRYRLTVYTKSGKSYSASYANVKERDSAKTDLIRQIERATTEHEQKVLNRLYLIQNTAERMDKRQLKIWRQLKDLLGIETWEP